MLFQKDEVNPQHVAHSFDRLILLEHHIKNAGMLRWCSLSSICDRSVP